MALRTGQHGSLLHGWLQPRQALVAPDSRRGAENAIVLDNLDTEYKIYNRAMLGK